MTTLSTGRVIPASPDAVFDAFRDPARLARWWGPDGFTNTFEVFEFRPGGRWSFAMHGPNGATYPNESEFASVVPGREVVVRHLSGPRWSRGALVVVGRPAAAPPAATRHPTAGHCPVGGAHASRGPHAPGVVSAVGRRCHRSGPAATRAVAMLCQVAAGQRHGPPSG